MVLVLVLLGVFGLLLVLQFGALVELFHQLQQVRAYLELEDSPTPLELGRSAGLRPSQVGLPPALDAADRAMVLFLSTKCETCYTIAAAMRGGAVPPALWLVVEPTTGDPGAFLAEFDLRGERVLVDADERIAGQLGLDITPSAITVEQGRLVRAQTVPSVRQLYATLPAVTKRGLGSGGFSEPAAANRTSAPTSTA